MPVRTYESRADYDRDYETRAFGIRLNYDRAFGLAIGAGLARLYVEVLGIQPADSILIFGCGFGWSAEVLESQGYQFVLGVDTSPYIQSEKDLDEESLIDSRIVAEGLDPSSGRGAAIKSTVYSPGPKSRASRGVLNENGRNGGSRGRIKQALGLSGNDRITWAITEQIIETMTDAEVIEANDNLQLIADNVVHVIIPEHLGPPDAQWNWKTMQEWKDLLSPAMILEGGDPEEVDPVTGLQRAGRLL